MTGRRVWPAALLVAAAHTTALRSFSADGAVNGAALLGALPVGALLVALFRAGYVAATAAQRETLRWLRHGAVAGGVLFAASALATWLAPEHAAGFGALALAPVAAAFCWLIAVLRAPRPMPVTDAAPAGAGASGQRG